MLNKHLSVQEKINNLVSLYEKDLIKEALNKIKGTIPLGRIAITEELTSAIEFLVSDKNTYITGSGIDINGGQYLSS